MKSGLITLILTVIFLFIYSLACSETNVITINAAKELGEVNKKIFGNNFQGIDPSFTGRHWLDWVKNRAATGMGLWDPKMDKPVTEVMSLAREAGISIVRYAMGTYRLKNIVDTYDKDGNLIKRSVKYGLDEFMETMKAIGAEPVIIIPIHPHVAGGTDKDYSLRAAHAADIVEYLNSPCDGSNPNGGTDWASVRAKNGHPDPYNVKYFEIGNEPFVRPNIGGVPRKGGSGVDFGWGYADLYNKYSRSMKAVDPSVKNGLYLSSTIKDKRNNIILRVTKKHVDYVIIHLYYSQDSDLDGGMNKEDRFKLNLSRLPLDTEPRLKMLMEEVEQLTERSDIQFGISEYNCAISDLCQERLAGALLNAEVLKTLMQPEYRVLMANHWLFVNTPYGMIQNRDYLSHNYNKPIIYKKRPIYYVYELYKKYFGDILIEAQVSGDTYDVKDYKRYMRKLKKDRMPVPSTHVPYLSVNSSKSMDGNKLYLVVINKNTKDAVTSSIELNNFKSRKTAHIWILNGPSLTSTNEISNTVNITHKRFEISSNPFRYTFEPHSLTAIEINSAD